MAEWLNGFHSILWTGIVLFYVDNVELCIRQLFYHPPYSLHTYIHTTIISTHHTNKDKKLTHSILYRSITKIPLFFINTILHFYNLQHNYKSEHEKKMEAKKIIWEKERREQATHNKAFMDDGFA